MRGNSCRFVVLLSFLSSFLFSCAAPQIVKQPGKLGRDFRNEKIPLVRKFDKLKGGTIFKDEFEKKGEVCPLCQF